MFQARGISAFNEHIVDPGFAGQPIISVTRMTEENDVIVAEGEVLARREDGATLPLVFCDVFEMENGKIRRLVSYLLAQEELEEINDERNFLRQLRAGNANPAYGSPPEE